MKAPAPFQPGAGFAGRPRSISTKLNLILLITVTATFLVAGLTLNSWLGTRLEERGIEGLKQTNQQVLDMVEAYANVLERSAEMLGATFQATFLNNLAVDPAHPVQTGDQLLPALRVGDIVQNNNFTLTDRFSGSTGGVATLFVRQGNDFYRVATSLRNPQGQRVVGTALDNKHPAYGKLLAGQSFTGPATLFGRDYMAHYMPIRDPSGRTIAASFIGLDFTDGLKALKARVLAVKVGERGYPFVLDAVKEPGLAVIHPAVEGKNIIGTKDKNGTEVVRRLLEMKSGELRYWWQNNELGETTPREKISVVAPFDKWGWAVGTGAYVDDLSHEMVAVRWILIVTGLVIVVVLATAIMWTTHRWVSRPLAEAVQVTRKVADGDLTQQISAKTADEVGVLLTSLDGMSRHLREMVSEIDVGVSHLASNSHQLAQASEVVARGSGEQSDAANAMAATLEELTASVHQVAIHAESCREMATHSGLLSDNGIAVIGRAVDGMTRIAQTVGHSSSAVTHLGDELQQISHFVQVIREIADQTNLLALNAAIEAARAGEAGRGFAVVADEVRKFAERTTHSTQEITVMVDRIQRGAAHAVDSMQTGENQVQEGVALANEASHRIQEIKGGADDVSTAVVGISDALREQTLANQEISRNVERIASQAEQNHQQAQTTAATAQGMEHLSEQLRASIARFRI